MKPIVILYPSKDNKIVLTKEDFEGYLKQAYDAGYNDGQNAKWYWWQSPYYTNTITTPNTQPITPDYYKVTCEAHNTVGD